MRWCKRGDLAVDRLVQDEDLVSDASLVHVNEDMLDHMAIARAVAEIAIVANTPTNIALFGPWGSGKSSIYTMTKSHIDKLTGGRTSVVRYDAWKFGGVELKRNFIQSVAKQLKIKDNEFSDWLHQPSETFDLRLPYWLLRNWRSLLFGAVVAIILAAVFAITLAGAKSWLTKIALLDALAQALTPAGTVFGLALVALVVGPKVMEGALKKSTSTPPSASDQFGDRFESLVSRVCKSTNDRLVVFIDELDRCAPADVVATLVDLKTFLDQERCIFIVAADGDVIKRSLQKLPQAKPVREDEPYYATAGAFLDKVFQFQIALPPLRPKALTDFARTLVQSRGGVWQAMRNTDLNLFDTVVFALVPTHVRSPRRVKVLLNNFAANARIVEARGLPWLERAEQLAVLTVLETEFPAVAAELTRTPRLLSFIRGIEEPDDETRRIVERFQDLTAPKPASDDPQQPETPAGVLLTDSDSGRDAAEEARVTLNRDLNLYLLKVQAVGVSDPTPDLVYLRTAGRTPDLLAPRLGELIDLAADTPPDVLVGGFADVAPETLREAVRLIVAAGEASFGPGRLLAYESACRLAEGLSYDDLAMLSTDAAPALAAEVRNPEWRREAIPGAVVLLAVADMGEQVETLTTTTPSVPNGHELVPRIAKALQYTTLSQSQPIYQLLKAGYAFDPTPVETSLAELNSTTALNLWHAIGHDVLAIILSSAVNAPTSDVTATSPAKSASSTSQVADRVAGLVAAARDRSDDGAVLSGIVESVQTIDAPEFQQAAVELIPLIRESVLDEGLVQLHGLVGLQHSASAQWTRWADLLPESGETSARTAPVSPQQVLVERILPRIPVELDPDVLAQIPPITARVAAIVAEPTRAEISAALRETFERLRWTDDDETVSGEVRSVRPAQRAAAHECAEGLRIFLGDDTIDFVRSGDAFLGLSTLDLTEAENQQAVLDLVDSLSSSAAKLLVEALASYKPHRSEKLQVLQIEGRARVRCNWKPFTTKQLASLNDTAISTSIAREWLSLKPPVSDAIKLLSVLSRDVGSLRRYCTTQSTRARSKMWLRAVDLGAARPVLAAIGRAGVDETVVVYIAKQMSATVRIEERQNLVALLHTSQVKKPNGTDRARKAATKLTADLLDRGTVGDTKLAAENIVWAGGAAGKGSQGTLRKAFDTAVKQGSRTSFSKGLLTELNKLGLLTRSKGSFVEAILGVLSP
jgi:hypothetical protein